MKQSLKSTWMMFGLMAVALMLPDMAAAGDNPIATVLCNVVTWVTGPVGAAIATLAIIIIGLGALLGKVSWGMALIVGLGIAIIFGAEQLVGLIAGDGAATDCGTSTGGISTDF